MNLVRLRAIMRKEFIHVVRDPGTLALVIIMPVMMMFIFGYVVSTDVRSVSTAVALQDTGLAAREIFERFEQTGYFRVDRYVRSAAEAGSLIQAGEVRVGIIIPSDYSDRIARRETAYVQVLIDGSDPVVSRMALTTAEFLGQMAGTDIMVQRLQAMTGGNTRIEMPVEVRARIWYNPNMDTATFNLPGLSGMLLQSLTIVLIAHAMVREREHGTIEQLIVTPVRPSEMILGKMMPYVVVSIIVVILVMVIAVFYFGMRIVGSVAVLSLNALIFLLGSLGLGLLVSTVSSNQMQATQLSTLLILPSILLSGYVFPFEAMPPVLQIVGYTIPLTHFLQVLRGVILKGIGMDVLWRQTVVMSVHAVATLGLAVWRLRKTLD